MKTLNLDPDDALQVEVEGNASVKRDWRLCVEVTIEGKTTGVRSIGVVLPRLSVECLCGHFSRRPSLESLLISSQEFDKGAVTQAGTDHKGETSGHCNSRWLTVELV